jgi:hypothetical protein
MAEAARKKSDDASGEFRENQDLEHTETSATYFNGESHVFLTPEHQRYLIERHGTLDLDPIPGPGGADPYNWPNWKVIARNYSTGIRDTDIDAQKVTNLTLVAFHALMCTFTAAAIIPAYENISLELRRFSGSHFQTHMAEGRYFYFR